MTGQEIITEQRDYFVAINGQQTGPHNASMLQQLVSKGQLTQLTLVWKIGMEDWMAASLLPELKNLFVVPHHGNTPTQPQLDEQFYIAVNGQQSGPYNMKAMAGFVMSEQLTPQSIIWRKGLETWIQAKHVIDFAGIFGSSVGEVPHPLM